MSEARGRGDLRYWPFYCEENVWHLCGEATLARRDPRALFIANPGGRVAVWGQRLSKDPELPIAWDYHVVVVARAEPKPGSTSQSQSWEIWDFDGVGPLVSDAGAWLAKSFRGAGVIPPQFEPRFRLVPGPLFRQHFCSDRRHMRGVDGQWFQAPPPWPPIDGELGPGSSNLYRFLDTLDETGALGVCADLDGLRRALGIES